ncbi:MAG: hypothetical protein IPK64_05680 [bacterium]|nr:hypothetical protein [bacterium]
MARRVAVKQHSRLATVVVRRLAHRLRCAQRAARCHFDAEPRPDSPAPCRSEDDLNRLRILIIVLGAWMVAALALYEVAAKAPAEVAVAWPGRRAAGRAEAETRWRPPTGLLPIDKLLHEGEEAARFYAALAGFRSPGLPQAR